MQDALIIVKSANFISLFFAQDNLVFKWPGYSQSGNMSGDGSALKWCA